jgi:hypothetical protein
MPWIFIPFSIKKFNKENKTGGINLDETKNLKYWLIILWSQSTKLWCTVSEKKTRTIKCKLLQ